MLLQFCKHRQTVIHFFFFEQQKTFFSSYLKVVLKSTYCISTFAEISQLSEGKSENNSSRSCSFCRVGTNCHPPPFNLKHCCPEASREMRLRYDTRLVSVIQDTIAKCLYEISETLPPLECILSGFHGRH